MRGMQAYWKYSSIYAVQGRKGKDMQRAKDGRPQQQFHCNLRRVLPPDG